VPAGKIGALVAARDPLLGGAGLDRADAAVEKDVVRKTALAMEIVHADAVETGQALLELEVVVPVGDVDRAHPAVQTARRGQLPLLRFHGPSFHLPLTTAL
jgi:hypothetical protein